MAKQVFFNVYDDTVNLYNGFRYNVGVWDTSTDTPTSIWWADTLNMGSQITVPYTEKTIYDGIVAQIKAYALANHGLTVPSSDIIMMYGPQQAVASKRQLTYSGTTNSSGAYAVTFGSSFPAAPNIQANIVGGSDSQIIKITSVSTTGFTVTVRNRNDVVGLLPTWSNVNGASVDVIVTEK